MDRSLVFASAPRGPPSRRRAGAGGMRGGTLAFAQARALAQGGPPPPLPNSRPRWMRRRDRVDTEELESEAEPVSEAAAAVEYVRNGKREFFLGGPGGANGSAASPSSNANAGEKKQERRRGGRSNGAAPDTVATSQLATSTTRSSPGVKLTVIESATTKKTWRGKAADRFLRYFLPDGYPESVGNDYVPYTRWRLAAFFFGGSVGVFSTQGLLLAVGVGRQSAAPLAAALQWVIRDGMGRAGRMLFSQVGTGFDAETKQYRLAAAFVLNLSCALESITPAIPHLFLPLACIANMAKGASTVAAASTRSAIYRSFMRAENLGDITAKQETVGVAGDLMGTAVGILLSRLTEGNVRLAVGAFVTVSIAHLFAVYKEIKGIQLGTLNRQRAHMLIKKYLADGRVPNLADGNRNERILNRPWLDSLHAPNIDLGARLHECAPDAEALSYLLKLYKHERYLFTYEDTRLKIVLRNDATSHDALKSFLQADYFWNCYKKVGLREDRNRSLIEESYRFANSKFDSFLHEATQKGWRTTSVLLRPIGRRAAWGSALPAAKKCKR
jgi:hypothetical protein